MSDNIIDLLREARQLMGNIIHCRNCLKGEHGYCFNSMGCEGCGDCPKEGNEHLYREARLAQKIDRVLKAVENSVAVRHCNMCGFINDTSSDICKECEGKFLDGTLNKDFKNDE